MKKYYHADSITLPYNKTDVYAMVIALLFAGLAAVSNAASSLLQRKANHMERKRALIFNPIWLLGFGAAFLSFLFQVGALSSASLAVVQPILALELALVVLGSGIFFRSRIDWHAWTGVALVTVGTVALILALDPEMNTSVVVTPLQWFFLIGTTASAVVITRLSSLWVKRASYRGGLLGVSTGLAFGLASCLLKGTVLVYEQHGIGVIPGSWLPYAALAASIASFWLLQITLRNGKLIVTQPGVTLAGPLLAIIWGNLIFHETMNGGGYIVLAALSALVLIGGTIVLARAPALAESK